jgi:bifunctional NMN adenylyltransferase/nudix hydrolase
MLKSKDEIVERDGVGVIVGRFQVSELTEGHRMLFDSVIARHLKTVCVIGLSPLRATKQNPLDFEARRRMLSEEYPDLHIVYAGDQPEDDAWSRKLDRTISSAVPPESVVTLYGSRDSFIKYYSGRYNTKELEQESFTSGSRDRTNVAHAAVNGKDFRKGVIWATQNQYDTAFTAVDAAILRPSIDSGGTQILLGRKENETKYRFIGGFIDPRFDTGAGDFMEQNAKREVQEETGIETDDYKYIGSFIVDDWRYRSEKSKIASMFFKCTYVFGTPKPDDDIHELRWFNLHHFTNEDFLADNLVETHNALMRRLLEEDGLFVY